MGVREKLISFLNATEKNTLYRMIYILNIIITIIIFTVIVITTIILSSPSSLMCSLHCLR